MEDLLFSNVDLVSAPVVLAIMTASLPGASASSSKERSRNIGIAFADTNTRELGVAQFVDNDLFSNTEVDIWRSLFSTLEAHRPPPRIRP